MCRRAGRPPGVVRFGCAGQVAEADGVLMLAREEITAFPVTPCTPLSYPDRTSRMRSTRVDGQTSRRIPQFGDTPSRH